MSHFGAGIFDDDPPPPPPRKPAKQPAPHVHGDAGPTTPPGAAPTTHAAPPHRERPPALPPLDEPGFDRQRGERPPAREHVRHEQVRQEQIRGPRHAEHRGERDEPRRGERELHYGRRDEPDEPHGARDAAAQDRGWREPRSRDEPLPPRERDDRRDPPRDDRRPQRHEYQHPRHHAERDDRHREREERHHGEREERPRAERSERDPAPSSRQPEARPRSAPQARAIEQIAVFVNLPELEAEARRNGGELAYRKVLRAVAAGRDVVRAVCALPQGTSAGAQAALRAAGFELLPTPAAAVADALATAAAGLLGRVDAIVLAPWSGNVARSLPRGPERLEAAGFDGKAPPGSVARPLGRDCLFIP